MTNSSIVNPLLVKSRAVALTLTGLWLVAWVSVTPAADAPANESPAGWYLAGEREISDRRERNGAATARNIILFVGDGMSIATIAAARILAGQQAGGPGEQHRLAFESFPHTALARTYNTNQQTPDSAGTMTAMATGVKTYAGAIAVDQHADRSDCTSIAGRELVSIVDLAKSAGMAAGIVTTSRITHATPAVLYAKSPERRWEADVSLPGSAREAGCRDIARQLVEYPIGGGIDVIFGGGRAGFLPSEAFDPEHSGRRGRRQDRVDLIRKWLDDGAGGTNGGRNFVSDRASFETLAAGGDGMVMGLFEPSHMNYEHDRPGDPGGEPSLAEMTVKALEILQGRDAGGFVLMVEGARIDHAHHAGNAYRALTDTIAFSDAIAATMERIDPERTLVVVTADHGHSLAFGGYASRGNPILGLVRGAGAAGEPEALARDLDGKPYTTLTYYNGPGFRAGPRPDYDKRDPLDPDFRQEAIVGLSSSTHSGEDVAVYATGPGADALHGSIEQHLIFHAMVQAQPALAALAEQIKNPAGLPDWAKLLELNRRTGPVSGRQTSGGQMSSETPK